MKRLAANVDLDVTIRDPEYYGNGALEGGLSASGTMGPLRF
jgi:hypothetical protein